MAKTPTSLNRSANMRAIKSKDTVPEMLVRKIARNIAPGYRLHRKDLPGKPDLAWISTKKAVFVHGCFWHGHDCKRGARVPKENRDYWLAKINRNRERDAENLSELSSLGWTVLFLWECELAHEPVVRDRLTGFLSAY